MKKIFVIGLISLAVSGCSSNGESVTVTDEGVAPELITKLTAAQELESDIEKLNREIDSLLNTF